MELRQGRHKTKMVRFFHSITELMQLDEDDEDDVTDSPEQSGVGVVARAVATLQGLASTERVTVGLLQEAYGAAEESLKRLDGDQSEELSDRNDTVYKGAVASFAKVCT